MNSGAYPNILAPFRSPSVPSAASVNHPKVSLLVRLQAKEGSTVTNQKCEPVRLTDLARHVAILLDGVHSRNDVMKSVAHQIQSGRLDNDWIFRLEDGELNVELLTGNVLRHLRDYALRVGNPEAGEHLRVARSPFSFRSTVTGLGNGICTRMNRATRQSGGVDSQERGWCSWR